MKIGTLRAWMIIMMIGIGECLKCFECDNRKNPACGVFFKAYQYQAVTCHGENVKCGLQRQPEKDKFIGILRRCYQLGMMGSGVDESDGCQSMQLPPSNNTFTVCFCSEDYCNNGNIPRPPKVTMMIIWGTVIKLFALVIS